MSNTDSAVRNTAADVGKSLVSTVVTGFQSLASIFGNNLTQKIEDAAASKKDIDTPNSPAIITNPNRFSYRLQQQADMMDSSTMKTCNHLFCPKTGPCRKVVKKKMKSKQYSKGSSSSYQPRKPDKDSLSMQPNDTSTVVVHHNHMMISKKYSALPVMVMDYPDEFEQEQEEQEQENQ